jgi:hypothetical protein
MRTPLSTLVKIDRMFAGISRIVQLALGPLTSIATENRRDLVVMKFFGMGSIIRMFSLCEERGIDLSHVVLVTSLRNAELCRIWGVRGIFISDESPARMITTSLAAIQAVRELKPRLLVDFEKCSHLAAILRTVMGWRAGCKTVGFEMRSYESRTATIYSISDRSQLDILLTGMNGFPTRSLSRLRTWMDVKQGKVIININTSTLLPARKYSLDSFSELIHRLTTYRSDLAILLTGTAEERDYVQQLAGRFDARTVINVAGEWTLTRFVAELAECELFITCDSAPLHLAASMNVATLALWGPTQPEHFGYRNSPRMQSLSLALPCSPCFLHPRSRSALACNGSISCLRDLTPATIEAIAVKTMEMLPSSREIIFPSKYVPVAADVFA